MSQTSLEAVQLALGAVAQLLELALGAVAHLAALVGLGALGLEGREVLLQLLGPVLDARVAALRRWTGARRPILPSRSEQVAVARVLVDGGDHVRREVDDLLEVLRGEVEQVAEAAEGTPLKYQMWVTGAASSMWPMRSRRTLDRVTSTPQRSQMMPLKRTRLYLPQ